jgi:putative proteasome-type protease
LSPFRQMQPQPKGQFLMTYCAGLLVKAGLVMIADTRTNAGVDNVSTFRKLHIFETPGDRVMAIATAGNLSVTQSALSMLAEGVRHPETDEMETLQTAPSMFRAAQLIGACVRTVHKDIAAAVEPGINADCSLLFGGQIKGGPMKLYLIYTEGNFIECGRDTPFLQIGEHKYGKPILVRSLSYDSDLYDALKIGLVSFDSTIRSNLAVGLPIDLAIMRRDDIAFERRHRIEPGDAYFQDISERWSQALVDALIDIPRPPYASN